MSPPSKPAPPRPELERLVRESEARFAALSPEQQKAHRAAQQRSFVIGNMPLSRPDMTREQVEAIYDKLDLTKLG